MNIILEEKGLIKYVEETLEDIIWEGPLHNEDKHVRKEKKCKSLLVKHIADNQLEYVKDKMMVKDMYDSLRTAFERKSIAGQLLLRKKLITMKYDESINISSHILEFDKTVRQLKSIGAKMEEMDLICHLLLTLPKSYASLVTALETMQPEMLNMEFVKSRLQDEYNKRYGSKAKNEFNDSVAMNVNSCNYRCHNCGRLGHKRSECRFKDNAERSEYRRSECRNDGNEERSEYRRLERRNDGNEERSEYRSAKIAIKEEDEDIL